MDFLSGQMIEFLFAYSAQVNKILILTFSVFS